MSKWVKAQSQEFLAFLIILIILAGLGGFIYYKKNIAAQPENGEGGGFLSWLPDWIINVEVNVPEGDDGDDRQLPGALCPDAAATDQGAKHDDDHPDAHEARAGRDDRRLNVASECLGRADPQQEDGQPPAERPGEQMAKRSQRRRPLCLE